VKDEVVPIEPGQERVTIREEVYVFIAVASNIPTLAVFRRTTPSWSGPTAPFRPAAS
jgi:hypothetical protein